MSNHFLYQPDFSDFARESTLEIIQNDISNNITMVEDVNRKLRTVFHQLIENGGSSQIAINIIAPTDFIYTSTSNNTFITSLHLCLIDPGTWSKNNWGAIGTTLNNGYRVFYDRTGSSKTYLTDPIVSNNQHAIYFKNYFWDNSAGGSNRLTCEMFFDTPILLENSGTIGLEIGIDDLSVAESFTVQVQGYVLN